MDVARVTCDHAHRCGGCPLIDFNYGEQLRAQARKGRAHGASLTTRRSPGWKVAPPPRRGSDRSVIEPARSSSWPRGARQPLREGRTRGVQTSRIRRVLSPALLSVADALRARVTRDEGAHGPLAPWDGHGGGTLRRDRSAREVASARGELPTGCSSPLSSSDPRRSDWRTAPRSCTVSRRRGRREHVLGVAVNLPRGGRIREIPWVERRRCSSAKPPVPPDPASGLRRTWRVRGRSCRRTGVRAERVHRPRPG